MEKNPIIVWFRRDLRVADNPALFHASQTGAPIVPVFVLETDNQRPLGSAAKLWLHHSLKSLQSDLPGLVIRKGNSLETIESLISETGASAIYWNRRYGIDRNKDALLKEALTAQNIDVKSFNGNLISEPWEVKTKSGDGYYKVFSPYWRAVLAQIDVPQPLPVPKIIFDPAESLSIEALGLLPNRPDWGSKMIPHWTIGEAGAWQSLNNFLDGPVDNYKADRDRADKPDATSRLSPHLAFGEISPRQIWHATKDRDVDGAKFLSEVGWREFSYNLLYHNPELRTHNFKNDFDAFPWSKNEAFLEAWQSGQTGYPFVDAGMRELWATGYMHNRVRMVAASFLIKLSKGPRLKNLLQITA